MRSREYGAKFAASERLKFSGAPGFIKLNFINRAGRAQRAAMKFCKAAAQQNVHELNLKFYPARSRRGLNNPRKFGGGHGERRNFSAAKFNAPKRH